MLEIDIRIARDACGDVDLPKPFVLVGQGGANVIGCAPGQGPFVIDGEGVELRGGAVFVWCRTGCCAQIPRKWPSVDSAADYHGSYVVETGGIRLPVMEGG